MNPGGAMSKESTPAIRFNFAAPWHERLDDGTLSAPYGPPSPAAHARAMVRHRDWSFKRVTTPSKVARAADAGELRAFMRLEDGTLRLDMPKAEVDAYLLVIERGHSERWAASKLGVSRRTVRVRLERLSAKAGRP